jgi:hypothetical protein
MSRSQVADVHMHIYETKRSGDWQKAPYEIWEYGHRTHERLMALPLLAREEKEAILGANAARVLGLETPPAPRPAR